MEYENHYASKGVAGAGLGLGIAGTALGLMAGGLNGGALFGNNNACHGTPDGVAVNRYEAAQSARIAELETEVKLRDANFYALTELGKFRDYVDRKFDAVNASISQQNAYNATNTATLNCMSGQIATLMSLTKTVIPNGNVCPGWGDVTVTVTPTTTT